MNFEQPPSAERKIPQLTQAQYDRFTSCSSKDPELNKWLSENGVKFNTGKCKVKIDGVAKWIYTDEDDFGLEAVDEAEVIQPEPQKRVSLELSQAVAAVEARKKSRGGGYRRVAPPAP